MNQYIEKRNEKGFTLIELLIAIVVVGILAAVAIVGIAGLTNTGSKSACKVSADGAKAASAAYYANQTPNVWPTTIAEMSTQVAVTNSPPVYVLPAGGTLNVAGTVLTGNGWTLTIGAGGAAEPTFTCA
jgi:prepilin-type N-terminal cleavage/methylation domain-containing protein